MPAELCSGSTPVLFGVSRNGLLPAQIGKIRLTLLQKPRAAANSCREMAGGIRRSVNEILFASLKIESAIATADTGRHHGAALLHTLVGTRLVERYLKHGWVLLQVSRHKSSDLRLHQCPFQLDMFHRALEYYVASVGVPMRQVLGGFN